MFMQTGIILSTQHHIFKSETHFIWHIKVGVRQFITYRQIPNTMDELPYLGPHEPVLTLPRPTAWGGMILAEFKTFRADIDFSGSKRENMYPKI